MTAHTIVNHKFGRKRTTVVSFLGCPSTLMCNTQTLLFCYGIELCHCVKYISKSVNVYYSSMKLFYSFNEVDRQKRWDGI